MNDSPKHELMDLNVPQKFKIETKPEYTSLFSFELRNEKAHGRLTGVTDLEGGSSYRPISPRTNAGLWLFSWIIMAPFYLAKAIWKAARG